ncbi:hypothetical protein BDV09DRAFT_169359 [Aspergillus tetrazonus]
MIHSLLEMRAALTMSVNAVALLPSLQSTVAPCSSSSCTSHTWSLNTTLQSGGTHSAQSRGHGQCQCRGRSIEIASLLILIPSLGCQAQYLVRFPIVIYSRIK